MRLRIVIAVLSAVLFGVCSSWAAIAWTLGERGTDAAGWALDDSGGKFFAVGIWGIPGYTFLRNTADTAEPAGNDAAFTAVTAPYNTIVMQSGYRKSYMNARDPLFMSGLSTMQWMMSSEGYSGETPLAADSLPITGSTIHFDRMNSIRENAGAVRQYFAGMVIPHIEENFRGTNLVHFIMDEPDTGRRGWFWSPEIMKAYHDAVHERSPDRLTYIGLGGSIGGNRYFYEKLFGNVFKVGTDPARGECSPEYMDTYNYAFDGTPQFEYISGLFIKNRWRKKPPSALTHVFYENVRQTAAAYGTACDVIGWNTYNEFRDFPEAAGETVDAIKDACGRSKPVWLFFDGAANNKPSEMSYGDYGKLVACQVYTSIIHGATGALFFAFSAPEEYMRNITALAENLGEHSSIFKLPETANRWDTAYHSEAYDHLHYSIRTEPGGKSYLIASNTSAVSPYTVNVGGFRDFELEPLGFAVVGAEPLR
ncbi:hypothetical protein ACFL6P_00320 [Candidatus Latescibacterota bacterium]